MSGIEDISNEELIEKLKEPGKENKLKARPKAKIKTGLFGGVILVIALLLFINWSYKQFGLYEISADTIHWHAKLNITRDDRLVVIPPSVGLAGDISHPSNLHTHEADNIIHMEIEGPVSARQIMLGRFFEVWEEAKEKPDKMFVNGIRNTDFYSYVMRDGDEIELVFE